MDDLVESWLLKNTLYESNNFMSFEVVFVGDFSIRVKLHYSDNDPYPEEYEISAIELIQFLFENMKKEK